MIISGKTQRLDEELERLLVWLARPQGAGKDDSYRFSKSLEKTDHYVCGFCGEIMYGTAETLGRHLRHHAEHFGISPMLVTALTRGMSY